MMTIELNNEDMPKTAEWTRIAINGAKIARRQHLEENNMGMVYHYTMMIERLESHLAQLEA